MKVGCFIRKIGVGIWHTLLLVQRFFLIVASLSLVLGLCLEIIFRYEVKVSLFGIEEPIVFIAFWLYFIGAAYGTYERSHIKGEVVEMFLKTPRTLAIAKAITSFLCVAVSILLSVWGYQYFIWGIVHVSRSSAMHLPMVFAQSSIFIGFILISLYFIAELIDNIRTIVRSDTQLSDIQHKETR